jgi:hypothetical protein
MGASDVGRARRSPMGCAAVRAGDGRVRRKRCRLEREVVVGKMGVRVRKPYI